MISGKTAEQIHNLLIERFGGSTGITDHHALDSALNRPYQTFENKALYPTAIDKAAALAESIIINHPFAGGNNRAGYVLLRIFLIQNGFDIKATRDEKYEFVIKIASAIIKYEEIVSWLRLHTAQVSSG